MKVYEDRLESVYSCNIKSEASPVRNFEYNGRSSLAPAIKTARPKVLIPVFPGTNCEYDSAKAVLSAGGEPETVIVKNLSGDMINVPISHGEGRFIASEELINKLAANGQIATQYVDQFGNATNDIAFNPNGSIYAIEGITSPDGRVFGKMGHSERIGAGLYKNVPGNYDIRMFEAAVRYFKDL